jgi:GAF domain-containing protein
MRAAARQALQAAILLDKRGITPRHGFTREGSALLMTLLDKAMIIMGADMGNIQLVDPTRRALQIAAQRGFQPPFLAYFARVYDGEAACGMAWQRAERIVIPDVADSHVFRHTPTLEVLLDAGVRGVQSTPLIGDSGRLLGVLSTHHHRPLRLQPSDLRQLDELVRLLVPVME